jgi:excinuclease UvrABC helicase subunit UvrB
VDRAIAAEVIRVAATPEHATSTIMIRARTRDRAGQLALMYRDLGVEVQTLHSGMGERARDALVSQIRAGQCRAVAVVNMLGEGLTSQDLVAPPITTSTDPSLPRPSFWDALPEWTRGTRRPRS